MKIPKLIAATVLLLIISSCGSTMKNTWTKEGYSGKNFEKILVIGISRNVDSRTVFENTVVKLLGNKGITAHNSLEAIPPVKDITQMSKERIVAAVRDGNYDGVIVSTLLIVNSEDILQSTSMGKMNYGFGGYIYSGYDTMYTPDYYREQKSYVLETRLFDANEESAEKALVWSGESKLTDPGTFEAAAAMYAENVVEILVNSALVK
ncbi:MAG: hypothetical protein ACJART_002933 [Maribacter sp.]|jgi:hypothetical protein